jgi:hypothetical protein
MNTNGQEPIEDHQEIKMINMNDIHESKSSFVLIINSFSYLRRQHDSSRHHHRGGDDDSFRSHRSVHRTPTKNGSSPSKTNQSIPTPIESSQILNEQPEITELDQVSTSSPINRLRRDDSERSSSRHSHHKKSSKRSRHDSDHDRNNSHHRRRSKEKLSSNSKKSTNQTESLTDVKE